MAVYTKLTFTEIQNHLKNYDLGELLEFKEIVAGIDNSNFIIDTQKGRFILTIFEGRIKSQELPFFIDLKLHLAKNGILCPRPMLDNQGLVIADLKGKKSAIVSFLQGKTLEPRSDGYYDNIEEKHCFEVGKILAKMHLAASDFKEYRKNDLGFDCFEALFQKFSHLVENYQKNLSQEILQAIDFVKSNWKPDLPSAAAHLDLFPDNVFFDDEKNLSGVIDFYFAANDLLVYDFAIVVVAWCFDENNMFDEQKFLAMKNGYEGVRNFSRSEVEFLDVALTAAALRFLLTRLHDMFFTPKNSLVNVKNPQEYLAKLRKVFVV